MKRLLTRLRMDWVFFKHDRNRDFEKFLCWLSRKLPKKLRYWTVVTAACDATDQYPGEVTALQMMEKLETC